MLYTLYYTILYTIYYNILYYKLISYDFLKAKAFGAPAVEDGQSERPRLPKQLHQLLGAPLLLVHRHDAIALRDLAAATLAPLLAI